CPFCDNGNLSIRLIYKDALVMAFPTNIPITPGHSLVCPARHIAKIDDLSTEEIVAIKSLIIKLKVSLKKCLGAEGFNIAWNEGETAGQSVGHLHIHVVPRTTGDTGICGYDPRKFLYRPGSRDISPDQELQEVSELIKLNLK
ncbi:MAG TPA: HIT domain-containing protein, partial [Candidatus Paceibacterota bacterium]